MIKLKKPKNEPKVSAGSMADIAFLLLVFFLVATTLQQDKGLMMQLPPDVPPTNVNILERNLFKIRINSSNQFLIQNEVRNDLKTLTAEVKAFVMNRGANPKQSDSPKEAIISIKTQRGTKYENFILVLDEVKEAYYQLYGERVGMTSEEFRKLDRDNPAELALYQEARYDFPMNISIANPDPKSPSN